MLLLAKIKHENCTILRFCYVVACRCFRCCCCYFPFLLFSEPLLLCRYSSHSIYYCYKLMVASLILFRLWRFELLVFIINERNRKDWTTISDVTIIGKSIVYFFLLFWTLSGLCENGSNLSPFSSNKTQFVKIIWFSNRNRITLLILHFFKCKTKNKIKTNNTTQN